VSASYDIEVAIPLGRRRRANIIVRDAGRRIVTTCCADLMDAAGRRRAARDLARLLGGDPADLERLLGERWAEALNDAEQAPPETADAPAGPRYHDSEGYLALVRPTQLGEVTVPLATWTARIVEQTVVDDGAERRVVLAVEGRLAEGTPLPRVDVSADQYPWMRWPVAAWGTRAVVHAGAGTADHARAAIQILSGDVPTRTVYAHLGWREVAGRWCYLHAGGAVGADGPAADTRVSPPESLAGYVLPDPPAGAGLLAALRASLAVLDVAPDRVTVPLLGGVYRAVLGAADYALHLSGPTGVGKSELAALAQQHHGAGLDARHLPGSWASTGNSLESLAFAAKDSLLVVDDFAPGGGAHDVQRAHREADRLLRAQGNRAGRARCRTDGTVRPARPPRGTILATGEDVPRGQSLRARLLTVELGRGELDWSRLTACQRDAAGGLYALALAGYVRWLAPRYPAVRDGLAAEAAALRVRVQAGGLHARTPGIVADLAAGWRHYLDYALEAGAIDQPRHDELSGRVWDALLAAGAEQDAHVAAAEPCGYFLRLLSGVIASGRGHVAGPDGGPPDSPAAWGWRSAPGGPGAREEWRPEGKRVGWVAGADLYLEPDASYAEAQELARQAGEALAVTATTLWRRLGDRNLLASRDEARKRRTVRRTLGGRRREVLHLPASALELEEPSQPSHTSPDGAGAHPGGTEPRDGHAGADAKPSQTTVPPGRNGDAAGTPQGTCGTVGTVGAGVDDQGATKNPTPPRRGGSL
jgi:hypothetical protein